MKHLIPVAFLLLFLPACSLFGGEEDKDCNPYPDIDYESRVTIHQGAWGNVWFWKGDFMPPIDCESGTIEPVGRKVFIYEKTYSDQVVPRGTHNLYSKVKTQLVTTTSSDEEGFYQISLPSGEYSIFVEEDGRFYANGFDLAEGQGGYVAPLVVKPDSASLRPVNIRYKATF